MLAGNLITVVLSCATGLIVACQLLPISDASALAQLLVGAAALPPLLLLLHPRAMSALLDRLFRLVGRRRLGERWLPPRRPGGGGLGRRELARSRAAGLILYAAAAHASFSGWLLCTGGMALAVSAGILFIPAPAWCRVARARPRPGAQARSWTGGALAVVVASRVLLIAADVFLASVNLRRRRPPGW